MITRKELLEAQNTAKRIRSIRKQIDAAYNTYHSPSFYGVKRTTLADPVTTALHRIDNLTEELAGCCESLIPFLDELMQIPDSVTRTIIVEHYLLGYSWQKCTKEVYGINRSESARVRIYRYLKKGEKNEQET